MRLLDSINNNVREEIKEVISVINFDEDIEEIIEDMIPTGILNFGINKHDNQENSKNR